MISVLVDILKAVALVVLIGVVFNVGSFASDNPGHERSENSTRHG